MDERDNRQPSAALTPASPIVQDGSLRRWRWLAAVCLAVLGLSLVLNPARPTFGVELCPMKKFTGLPCPGCGITRSIINCSRGNFGAAWRYHPLGPAAWLAAIVGASSLLWPRRAKEAVSFFWRRHDRTITGIILAATALLVVFGALRILFDCTGAPGWWPW